MKSYFLPFFVLLMFAPCARADGMSPSPCADSLIFPPQVLVSANAQFLAVACDEGRLGPGGGFTQLYIAGPRGLESFTFPTDASFDSLFLNDSGELVWARRFHDGGTEFFFAIYGSGSAGPENEYQAFLPDTLVTTNIGVLAGYPDIDGRIEDRELSMTGLTDQGVANGRIRYLIDQRGDEIVLPFNWDLPDLAVPEPDSLRMMSCGLIFLLVSRRRFLLS